MAEDTGFLLKRTGMGEALKNVGGDVSVQVSTKSVMCLIVLSNLSILQQSYRSNMSKGGSTEKLAIQFFSEFTKTEIWQVQCMGKFLE